MLRTNAENKIFIAIEPEQENQSSKNYRELKFITELKHNYSNKKEDRMYLHNGGYTTSISTGITESLSVGIDFDDSDFVHTFLLGLMNSRDVNVLNNNFIRLEIRSVRSSRDKTRFLVLRGKATFNFKNHMPSGNADELQKLQFDIMPQDDAWEVSYSNETEASNL